MAEHGGGGGGCCRCCFSFLLTSGLTALFMWLSLRTSKPTCSIQDFYLPALNKSDNSTSTLNNHTLYFDLKLDNTMKDKGVHYANISLTFLYNATVPVANYTVPAFYQGHKKNARSHQWVEARGVPWAAARNGSSTARFTVKMATRVKFKIMFWYTKRHGLDLGADVMVNDEGKKDHKKGIRLKSGAPDPGGRWVGLGPVVVIVTFLIIL